MGRYRVAAGLVATLLLLDTTGELAGEKIQRTPWRTVQSAAWETLKKVDANNG